MRGVFPFLRVGKAKPEVCESSRLGRRNVGVFQMNMGVMVVMDVVKVGVLVEGREG